MADARLIAAGLALVAACWLTAARAGDGTAVVVTDGDTLRLGAVRVRLFGIDAPEAQQLCARADGTPWPCGRAAAQRLGELMAQGPVRCRPRDQDRYGRLVSVCSAGGTDLGARLVAEGLARAYVRYSEDYVALEADARAAGLGLWQGAAEAPWDYRAESLAAAAGAPAGGGAAEGGWQPAAGGSLDCAIKGNVSAGGARIYHLPGEPAYARTRIETGRGEAWFCSEAQAQAAGFRPPRRP